MKQQDKGELEKVIDSNIYKENGKFICKFCGMKGNTADEAKMHLLMSHPLYLKYEIIYKQIPQTAILPWIDIRYDFTYRLESFVHIHGGEAENDINEKIKSILLNRLTSIKKFLLVNISKNNIDAFQIGIKNDFFKYIYWIKKTYYKSIPWISKQYGKDYNIYWLDENYRINKNFRSSMPGEIPLRSLQFSSIKKEDKLSLTAFNRQIDISYYINKNKLNVILRPKDVTPGLSMGAVHFSKGTKKENKGYGYSPIDFITDSLLLCEAERVFDQRLDIREISDIAVENNKPFITATFNCLTIKYPVEKRFKLLLESPEIEERCFKPIDFADDLVSMIKYYKRLKNKDKLTKNWLSLVDKLVSKYRIKV